MTDHSAPRTRQSRACRRRTGCPVAAAASTDPAAPGKARSRSSRARRSTPARRLIARGSRGSDGTRRPTRRGRRPARHAPAAASRCHARRPPYAAGGPRDRSAPPCCCTCRCRCRAGMASCACDRRLRRLENLYFAGAPPPMPAINSKTLKIAVALSSPQPRFCAVLLSSWTVFEIITGTPIDSE